MGKSKYRTANIIIQTILEGIIRAEKKKQNGIIKSHLIEYCALKNSTAEKYLLKLENAGYIVRVDESWGERQISKYHSTKIGRERYQWFIKINTELEDTG